MQLESVLGENYFLIGVLSYTKYVCDSVSIHCGYIFEFLAAQLPKIQNLDCNEC